MPKLSIIVPVYNMERFLEQCAQSLLNQSFQDIEIIFVNDGSKDKSPEMCDRYKKQRPDIVKVIHQENQSQNVAWNNGLNAATGEWVCFVDSDDWVELNMAEIMLKYAEGDTADIHVFSYYHEYKDCSVPLLMKDSVLTETEKSNFTYMKIDSAGRNEVSHAIWARVFRRSFIEEHAMRFYPHHFHHEDAIFNVKAFRLANKVCLHSEAVYRYRQVASGFIQRCDMKKVDAYLLYIKRYSEFVDTYFTGELARLMKQRMAVEQTFSMGVLYTHPRCELSRKERIAGLKKYFKNEPFRSAIKEYPLLKIRFAGKVGMLVLRFGMFGMWLNMFAVWKKMTDLKNKGTQIKFD